MSLSRIREQVVIPTHAPEQLTRRFLTYSRSTPYGDNCVHQRSAGIECRSGSTMAGFPQDGGLLLQDICKTPGSSRLTYKCQSHPRMPQSSRANRRRGGKDGDSK